MISLEIKSLGYCQSKQLVFLLIREGDWVLTYVIGHLEEYEAM